METLNVLLIEDDATDATLVRRSLCAKKSAALEHATTLQAGIELLARRNLDAVLLDLALPDSRGIDSISRIRARDAAIPIVVLTADGDEETAVGALAAGAQDSVVKSDLGASLLRRSIRSAIERSRIERDRAHLERRLRQVEKMESLGALCAGIGWGFNTLLGTIFDRCDQALVSLDGARSDAPVRTALLDIHRAAFRAAEMIQRLRDYAAAERSASGQIDLARFVLEASDFLATIVWPEIDIVCEAAPEALIVDVTRPELHRLMVSLVVNAAEAMGNRRGSIAISTGVLEADAAWLAETEGWPEPEPGPYAFLRVADSGGGLDAAARERLFDPFYTTKQAGRGLGLTGVAGVLQRRRGVLRIDANQPTGTVFTILFPRSAGRSGSTRS